MIGKLLQKFFLGSSFDGIHSQRRLVMYNLMDVLFELSLEQKNTRRESGKGAMGWAFSGNKLSKRLGAERDWETTRPDSLALGSSPPVNL